VREVRAAFGVKLMAMNSFTAMVLASDGGPPFVGEALLGRKKSGRGEHIALRCPECDRACDALYVVRAALRCTVCAKRRTRRQREHTLPAWEEHGGEEHDRVLRLLAGRRKTTRAARRKAGKMLDELVAADRDRLAAVVELAHAALLASSVTEHEIASKPSDDELAFDLALERATMGLEYW